MLAFPSPQTPIHKKPHPHVFTSHMVVIGHSNASNNVWHHFGKFPQSKIVNPEFIFGTKILLPAGKRARQYTNWHFLNIRVS
jgi:hypothetical protein